MNQENTKKLKNIQAKLIYYLIDNPEEIEIRCIMDELSDIIYETEST